MRKTIISIVGGIIFLSIGLATCGKLSDSKKTPKRKNMSSVKTVVVEEVKNKSLPIEISTTGALVAKDRAVLFSEVQGVFMPTNKPYKAGTRYAKGETLIRINQSEFTAQVASQRSSFKSLVTSTLADIQFDYPNELQAWKQYANSISADKTLPELPSTSSEKMNYFITNKNIYSTYYNIKNLETRLAKYIITAPFSGALVSADVTHGSLVSPGQKLGEFIQTGAYELELNVSAGLKSFLKPGKTVKLSSIDKSKDYVGTVSRINPKINQASQTIQLFVQVNSNALTEGEYLEAEISAQEVSDVYEISRNLIVDESFVFTVENDVLKKHRVQIVHSADNKLIVSGLKDKMQLIAVPISGGYEGMKVKINKEG